MGARWYEEYFGREFWAFARHEYTSDRTRREVLYLAETLEALAPGKRVLDLGCGMGRHAIALARAGYRVTGIDVSEWALDRAWAAAVEAGVHVDWRRLDLLKAQPWELPTADAAICIQAFGWGDDAEQLRMLRVLHSCLGPEGLLVLDHSSVTAILLAYVPTADVEIEGKRFRFRRMFDPMTGRSGENSTSAVPMVAPCKCMMTSVCTSRMKSSGS